MLEFIKSYWLEFFLGLVCTGLTWACKKFYSMYIKEKEDRENRMFEEFYSRTQADNEVINKRIDSMENMLFVFKQGLLSVQGHQFRKKCKELLAETHELTLDEYTQLIADHDAYNALGGNHEGDRLFNLVEKKAEKHLTD